ncbi:MAG TPA: T9SS type A sorting domain-containing protein [Saprospiraceae bacterium]|nr:T9SS type A sorting domain-containing protein [Saprospiraceae bacterium]
MKKLLTLLFISFTIFCWSQSEILTGDITTNTLLTSNNSYILKGFVYVKNGAVLTIEPGTIIKADKATKGALIITRGSKLIAEGTQEKPIVFTSNETIPGYGDWGGIILLGKSYTNTTTNGIHGEGIIEGGVDNANGDGRYGGNEPDDNSGILKFVRIEYPGIAFAPNNEINGLTLGGVGSGTEIDFVQVSYSGDDAFEWFGGTVNCKHLIAYRALDDDFDCDFGFSGNIQFALSVRDPLIADISGSNGFEIDNDASGSNSIPKTKPTFSNVTIIGPMNPSVSPDFKRGLHLRRNSEAAILNSLIIGNYPVGLFIDGDSCVAHAQSGNLEFKNNILAGMTELTKTTASTFDIKKWATNNENKLLLTTNEAGLVDINVSDPIANILNHSPANGLAKFDSKRIQNRFFDKVEYSGAFDKTNDWSCRWARFENGVRNNCQITSSKVINNDVEILITPLPAQQYINISFGNNFQLKSPIRISNFQGKILKTVNTQENNSVQVDTHDLINGIYLINITTTQGQILKKLIISQ